jgi:hypothetical protein
VRKKPNKTKQNKMELAGGVCVGMIYAKLFLPRQAKCTPTLNKSLWPVLYKGMIIIPVSTKHALHIHHWLICGALLCFRGVRDQMFVLGYTLTMMLQGLSYRDRFHFVEDNPWGTPDAEL